MTDTLLRIGSIFFQFFNIMIVANVMLRYINPKRIGPFATLILSMTEPLLTPLRRVLRFRAMDLSPFAVILLVEYVLVPLYASIVVRFFG